MNTKSRISIIVLFAIACSNITQLYSTKNELPAYQRAKAALLQSRQDQTLLEDTFILAISTGQLSDLWEALSQRCCGAWESIGMTYWNNIPESRTKSIIIRALSASSPETGDPMVKIKPSLSNTEADAISAARIVGGLVPYPNEPVKVLFGTGKTIKPNPGAPWINQYCSNIADRGKTATYKDDFTRKIAWSACADFFISQKHPNACKQAAGRDNAKFFQCRRAAEHD